MRINYSLSFALQRPVRPLVTGEYYVRLHCSAVGHRIKLAVGLTVPPAGWDKSTGRLRRGVRTADGRSAAINADLNRISVDVENALRKLAAECYAPPGRQEIRDTVTHAMGRGPSPAGRRTFAEALQDFMRESTVMSGWGLPTVYKFRTFGRIVEEYAPGLAVADINGKWMPSWMLWMLTVKRYRNETVKNELKIMRWLVAWALRNENITGGAVHCVNHKTGQTVCIELNHYSRAALAPYVHEPAPLPRTSNQRLNDYIKELGYLAGIDQPVTRTWYVGGQRRDETLPKYQLLGTHTGRHTFICMALQLGIPPTTVMQWTGHSGYKAMQPYISASSDAKARAMRLFDEMGDTNE